MQRVLATVLIMLVPGIVTAQALPEPGSDSQAVRQVVLDYANGARTADADLMSRAIHPELTNVLLTSYPQTGKQYLRHAGASYVTEVVRAGGASADETSDQTEVTLYDVGHGMAVARLASPRAISHMQLASVNGTWKIVNVLRVPGNRGDEVPAGPDEEAEAAITRTALDYIDGSFSGDAERMSRALHPELTKVLLARHPRTDRQFLVRMGATDLIEGTRAQLGLLDEEARNIDVTVFHVGSALASVKVVSALYIDHVQLASIDGAWKIVNVLWVPNPSAPAG